MDAGKEVSERNCPVPGRIDVGCMWVAKFSAARSDARLARIAVIGTPCSPEPTGCSWRISAPRRSRHPPNNMTPLICSSPSATSGWPAADHGSGAGRHGR